eukprot:TRINITY_DN5782_c0_g2_i1.p1 TRINITY_DN5782_c0_g2~~TRINITY_DN5782_c0_g2_i1.p1  ORF type:complete len:130 (+),score=8.56 TRINITY_DN5782_c0_g2_i1:84-473(+)
MSEPTTSGRDEEAQRTRLTCTNRFDALWFCYSPVYQMTVYYQDGVIDSCTKKWSELYDCLKLKTKPRVEQEAILEAQEKDKEPLFWTYKSKEEARRDWTDRFGHLQDGGVLGQSETGNASRLGSSANCI